MKRYHYILLMVTGLSMFACSTDIDLTAPYKDITVVYGLLDPREDTQWVRINKAFLGDGDALLFAQISDSLYYDSLTAYILAYNTSGTQVDSHSLEKVIDPFPKDSGIFAYDKNILYRTTDAINSANTYKIFVIKPNGDTTTSETVLCKNFFMTYPPLPSTIIHFEDPLGINQNPTITTRFTHDENSWAYQVGLRMNYYEWLGNDTANKVLKSFDYYFPMFTVFNAGGGFNTEYYIPSSNQVKFEIEKTDFYSAVTSQVAADPPGTPAGQLRARQFVSLDFLVLQARRELYDYITINQPSLSFVQKVTDYTNVTNGIGIFSSRSLSGINGLDMGSATKDSLRAGQFTSNLNFQ